MKNYKVLAIAGLFLALSAAKWLYPEPAAGLRQQTLELLGYKESHTELLQSLGRLLTKGGLGEGLLEALGRTEADSKTAPAETQDESAVEEMDLTPFSQGYTELLENMMEDETKAAAMAEPVPEVVSAFLESQKEYEQKGYPLPEKVRTDMPELPFTYSQPVAGVNSSGFGYRVHPIQGEVKFHYGTDFAADAGEDVLAFADGHVAAAGTSPSYGNYLILEHEGGFSSLYAHLSEFIAQEGDTVERGQAIARVGQTGYATGPHLHFELTLDGKYLNPEYYL